MGRTISTYSVTRNNMLACEIMSTNINSSNKVYKPSFTVNQEPKNDRMPSELKSSSSATCVFCAP